MKILQVLPYLQNAGTERHVLALSQALVARGCHVRLLAPDGPLKDDFCRTGIPHVEVPGFHAGITPALRGIAAGVAEAIAWGADLIHVHAGIELLFAVRRALKKSGPGVRSNAPAGDARAARIPTVFTVHSYFGKRPQIDYFLAARLSRRWAEEVIAVSHKDAELLVRYAPGLAGKLTVVHNGVPDLPPVDGDRSTLKRALLQEHGVAPGARLGLVVGRLTAQKGIDVLLDALAVYRGEPLLVLVAGEGPLRPALEAQARRLGLFGEGAGGGCVRVAFLGARHDVPRLLAAADLFVLPSRMEGLSLAVVEAHAAGVPSLVTDVGGNAEIVVDGETGLVVPSENPAALADGLARLLGRPDALKKMGEEARRRYEARFTVDHMVEATCAVYRRAVGITDGNWSYRRAPGPT